jgi:hypothetical protein
MVFIFNRNSGTEVKRGRYEEGRRGRKQGTKKERKIMANIHASNVVCSYQGSRSSPS